MLGRPAARAIGTFSSVARNCARAPDSVGLPLYAFTSASRSVESGPVAAICAALGGGTCSALFAGCDGVAGTVWAGTVWAGTV